MSQIAIPISKLDGRVQAQARRRPLGEYAIIAADDERLVGNLSAESFSRVVESRISTPASVLTATNRQQGDQVTSGYCVERMALAMRGSHEAGKPTTTLGDGWTNRPYSLRTIEDLGVRARAELYICVADVLMTSKNSVTK